MGLCLEALYMSTFSTTTNPVLCFLVHRLFGASKRCTPFKRHKKSVFQLSPSAPPPPYRLDCLTKLIHYYSWNTRRT